MPYIKQTHRDAIADGRPPATAGELNYVITLACMDYVAELGLSYQAINNVLGALEGAKQEFYRRVAVPYENGKLSENGDVY